MFKMTSYVHNTYANTFFLKNSQQASSTEEPMKYIDFLSTGILWNAVVERAMTAGTWILSG